MRKISKQALRMENALLSGLRRLERKQREHEEQEEAHEESGDYQITYNLFKKYSAAALEPRFFWDYNTPFGRGKSFTLPAHFGITSVKKEE